MSSKSRAQPKLSPRLRQAARALGVLALTALFSIGAPRPSFRAVAQSAKPPFALSDAAVHLKDRPAPPAHSGAHLPSSPGRTPRRPSAPVSSDISSPSGERLRRYPSSHAAGDPAPEAAELAGSHFKPMASKATAALSLPGRRVQGGHPVLSRVLSGVSLDARRVSVHHGTHSIHIERTTGLEQAQSVLRLFSPERNGAHPPLEDLFIAPGGLLVVDAPPASTRRTAARWILPPPDSSSTAALASGLGLGASPSSSSAPRVYLASALEHTHLNGHTGLLAALGPIDWGSLSAHERRVVLGKLAVKLGRLHGAGFHAGRTRLDGLLLLRGLEPVYRTPGHLAPVPPGGHAVPEFLQALCEAYAQRLIPSKDVWTLLHAYLESHPAVRGQAIAFLKERSDARTGFRPYVAIDRQLVEWVNRYLPYYSARPRAARRKAA